MNRSVVLDRVIAESRVFACLHEINLFNGQHIRESIKFTTEKRDYYIYGREPVDADFLEISLRQIKQLVSELAEVYQVGYLTGQEHVDLYGRSRRLDCEVIAQ